MNADEIINRWRGYVKDVSPGTVLRQLTELWGTFRSAPQLRQVWSDVCLGRDLLRDGLKGDYKDFPKRKFGLLIAALAYLALPVDLVPDFLPVVGWFDDAAVLAWAFLQCRDELSRYADWRRRCARELTIDVEGD